MGKREKEEERGGILTLSLCVAVNEGKNNDGEWGITQKYKAMIGKNGKEGEFECGLSFLRLFSCVCVFALCKGKQEGKSKRNRE